MNKILTSALRFLTRREYSVFELRQKLVRKGYGDSDIEAVILECQRLGFQSDARFAEQVCRVRIRQGYGPVRIRQELQAAQIDTQFIEAALDAEETDWFALARALKEKKYNQQDTQSLTDCQRQKQYLLRRGFPMEIITQVLNR